MEGKKLNVFTEKEQKQFCVSGFSPVQALTPTLREQVLSRTYFPLTEDKVTIPILPSTTSKTWSEHRMMTSA